MTRIGSIKRKELVRYLKKLGFHGPYSGGKHQFMEKGNLAVRLPNPHKADIGKELLIRILRQVGVKKSDWVKLTSYK